MPRRLRDFVPGFSYHLTQRGNRKSTVFVDDSDRRVYLKLLKENCAAQKVRIWAYSLMDNHVHHIVVGDEQQSISRAFQRIHGAFALISIRDTLRRAIYGRAASRLVSWTSDISGTLSVMSNETPCGPESSRARRTIAGPALRLIVVCATTRSSAKDSP